MLEEGEIEDDLECYEPIIRPVALSQSGVATVKKLPTEATNVSTKSKTNNIWCTVLEEENLANEMLKFGMKKRFKENDRNVESYEYFPNCGEATELLEDAMDCNSATPLTSNKLNSLKGKERNLITKKRFLKPIPIAKLKDNESKFSKCLATRLFEPKVDLVASLVGIIGIQKAYDIYEKTRKVEKKGGMMTLNGSRRRTSGGVFFLLVKNDSDLPQELIKPLLYPSSDRKKPSKKTVKMECEQVLPSLPSRAELEMNNTDLLLTQ